MTRVVILAAGKGTRMKTELPKVLVTLFDKPLVRFVIESVEKSGIGRPVVVVGHHADLVQAVLGDHLEYVLQKEQLGTGHAVSCCTQILANHSDNVLVLYGDMPFISPETINRISQLHRQSKATLTLATAVVSDFKDWRQSMYDYGRIIRNPFGQIVDIREYRDASDQEKEIKEVNPSYFCFKSEWLWENLPKLNNQNAKKEYYLTDLIKFAFEQKQKIFSMSIDPLETVGINAPDQHRLAEALLERRVVR